VRTARGVAGRDRAGGAERGGQGGEFLKAGGPGVFVGGDCDVAFLAGYGHGQDVLRVPVRVVAGLRAEGVAVLVFAADPMVSSKVLGGFGHGVGAPELGHLRVDKAPADGGVVDFRRAGEGGLRLWHDERRAGHAFDAARDDDVCRPVADGAGGGDHGIKPRGAEAVHGQRRDSRAEAREEDSHPGDVAVVLARLIGAAKDHFADGQVVEVQEAVDDPGGEVIRADMGEGTCITPDWGAAVGAEEDFCHVASSPGAGS
jgi:hypothetical protein